MRITRACALASGAAFVASVVLAGAAAAEPPVHERFHDEFTDTIEDYCGVPGLTVQTDGVVDGSVLIHSNPARFMDHLRGSWVDTNPANGKSISGSFTTMRRAMEGVDNGDGTLTVLFLLTGNDVTYGPDGKAIARDPGQIRVELLIDHNGTPSDPSDDEIIGFVRVVKESTGRTDDFCAAALAALT
jgi:hypothetical protein